MVQLDIEPHPSARVRAFVSRFPQTLGEMPPPAALTRLLAADAATPFEFDEAVRTDVRDMLRHGGYKPTGRGKPASEYLARAVAEGLLQSINLAVDACNATSLHSGLPISVVDLDLARAPFRIAIAPPGTRYVFNASGQEIDASGLLCLFDADGACGNAVKDAQRTKTHADTTRTLSILWGTHQHVPRLDQATLWYESLLHAAAVQTERLDPWSAGGPGD